MKEVPAFFVNPKKIKILIRFLLGREGVTLPYLILKFV